MGGWIKKVKCKIGDGETTNKPNSRKLTERNGVSEKVLTKSTRIRGRISSLRVSSSKFIYDIVIFFLFSIQLIKNIIFTGLFSI